MGGSKKDEPEEPVSSITLANLANQLIGQTDPLRQKLLDRSLSFLNDGNFDIDPNSLDVSESPLFLPLQQAVNRQTQSARRNILERLPEGGVLLDKLADLEVDRARTLTGIQGGLAQDELNFQRQRQFNELNLAASLATGNPLTASFGGLGQSGSISAQIAQAQATQSAASTQALGKGLGAFIGSKGAKGPAAAAGACWVAQALWGNDARVYVMQLHCLLNPTAWVRLYRRYGRRWAQWVIAYKPARLVAEVIWGLWYRRISYG